MKLFLRTWNILTRFSDLSLVLFITDIHTLIICYNSFRTCFNYARISIIWAIYKHVDDYHLVIPSLMNHWYIWHEETSPANNSQQQIPPLRCSLVVAN